MQNRVNLIGTTGLLMFFKFLLQQCVGDQQVLDTQNIVNPLFVHSEQPQKNETSGFFY